MTAPTVSEQAPRGIPAYTYDHIPALSELLPKNHGLPGFHYLQVAVENLLAAQQKGWLEVDGTMVYSIVGPKGFVHCKLYCQGKSIPGEPPITGIRLMKVDDLISDRTGHPLAGYPEAPKEPPNAPKPQPKAAATVPPSPEAARKAIDPAFEQRKR